VCRTEVRNAALGRQARRRPDEKELCSPVQRCAFCRILYPQGRGRARPHPRPRRPCGCKGGGRSRFAVGRLPVRLWGLNRPTPASRTAGRGLWRDGALRAGMWRRGEAVDRSRDPGSPHPACPGRSLTDQGVTSWEHRPWRYVLLCDHELSRIRHGSSPAVIHSARDIGGNSATTTIRPAPHRGQTRVGVTAASWTGGVTGSGPVEVVSA
jgi:hypothetical protein